MLRLPRRELQPSPNKDIAHLIAKALWDQFEYGLPDTPHRIAYVCLYILEKNGYTITKADE